MDVAKGYLTRREQPDMAEIIGAAGKATLVERTGAGHGSLTDEGLRYSVLDFPGCARYAHRLCWWALSTVPSLASALTHVPLTVLPQSRASVNINVLSGRGERYELHTDSVPWTAILFVTGPHLGGELWLDHAGKEMMIQPKPGLLVVLRGSKIPHRVLPLRDDKRRISVPISLMEIGSNYERQAGVDDHLYERAFPDMASIEA